MTSPGVGGATNVFPIWGQALLTYIVRREFRTEIISTRSGREQRRALRATPRKYLEYRAIITGDLWRLFNRRMTHAQRTSWYFPDQSRVVAAVDGLSVNDDTMTVSSVPAWLTTDAEVILRDADRMEVFTVDSVAGSVVTLAESASAAWPANTLVYPALLGWLRNEVAANTLRGKMIELALGVEVSPTTETQEPALAADETFNGRDVWTLEPFEFRPMQLNYPQYREVVDALQGPVSRFHPVTFGSRVWRGDFPMMDPTNADKVRSFFENMKGSRGEFYMPTFEYDLVPKVAAAAGSNTLRIDGTLTEELYFDSTIFKAVAAELPDGSLQYNLVSSIDVNAGDTVITFVDNWSAEIAVTARVSWMPVWRFASDILEIQWIFDFAAPPTRFALANPTFTMLEDLAVESP